MTMTVHAALVAARKLIETPDAWVKGRMWSRDEDGRKECYCAVGAIDTAISAERTFGLFGKVIDLMEQDIVVRGGFVSSFNDRDTTRHSDVLALFDRTIEAVLDNPPKQEQPA